MSIYSQIDQSTLPTIAMEEILPQRPPFVMVDRLQFLDDTSTVTTLTVRPDCILADGRHLSAEGIIENIAQTCAARIGYINKYLLHNDIKIGVIGAVSRFEMKEEVEVGTNISTQITIIDEVMGMTLAEATVNAGNRPIATASIKIALKD